MEDSKEYIIACKTYCNNRKVLWGQGKVAEGRVSVEAEVCIYSGLTTQEFAGLKR